MNPNERQIIEQIIKRAGIGFNLTDHCFKEQLDFINDRLITLPLVAQDVLVKLKLVRQIL